MSGESGQTIALTGATGFIGGHILAEARARGHRVRALTRRPAAASLHDEGVHWVRGSLADNDALRTLVGPADVVIHCAGLVKAVRPAHFFDANEAAVRALLHAVQAREGHRAPLLHMSSLAAREPHLSDYAASKAAGEQVLMKTSGQPWAIVRPPAVYGPGDLEILKLFKSLRYGVGLLPGGRENRTSVVYVEDLARFACDWVEVSARPTGEILEADDGAAGGYRLGDIYAEAARVLNRQVRMVEAPAGLLTMAAQINTAMARLTGRAAMLTPGKVRELRHRDWICRPNDAFRGHWQPRVKLRDGLEATFAWYRRNHLI